MMTTVVVFGGAGFLGRRLVHRLATEGMTVRVAMRHPDPLRIELRSMSLDRVTVAPADVRDQASVAAAIAGANAVVNTVSAYAEKGGVTFEAVHVHEAETVAREAVAAGIARLVLVSGIGADPDSGSPYIRARGRGELVVQKAFPGATIVRPGAMFGPGDALFGMLADLARPLPVLPLIGGGHTRLQPVFVEDVAEAVASILADCAVEKEAREAKRGAWGGTFEIPFVQKGGGRGKKKVADVVCPDFPIVITAGTPSLSVDPSEESPAVVAPNASDDMSSWTRLLAALLTPAIAILALVIAWAQWRLVRRREVIELFERRLSIYDAIRRVIGQIIPSGTVTDRNLHDFIAGSDRARFLFGQDVIEYLERFYRLLLNHQEAEARMKMGAGAAGYQQAVQAKHDSYKEISDFYEAFPKLISPYVRMDQKLPRPR
jgi:uncharacterized protein YbjT (DUF2867 family)